MIEDPFENVAKQLDWRGPNGHPMGHVVLQRSGAIELIRLHEQMEARVFELQKAIDAMTFGRA